MGLLEKWGIKAKKEVNNLLNQAFYQYLVNGTVSWFTKNRMDYVSKGYSDNEIVFAIVRMLLGKLTEPPLLLNKIVKDTDLKKYKSYVAKGGSSTHRIEALKFQRKALEEIETHPLVDLLKKPNDYQGQAEFLEAAFGYYKLLGETFIYGIAPESGPNKGKFSELHVLPAHLVTPVYSGNPYEPIRGYKFLFADPNIEIPATHVMHLKTWNPNWDNNGGQLRGFSPLEAGSKVLTRNDYNKIAQSKAFVNGGSAYLVSSGDSTKIMTREQIEGINDKIREKIKGPENYKNITATSGIVAVNKVGDTPIDMQLIDADKNDLERICMLFGVDADLFISGAKYDNKEKAQKALVSNVILADLIRFRDKFNQFILRGYESENLFLEFDTTVFVELQPDLKLMKEIYGQPLLTPNEVRSVFNWDASTEQGMDVIWLPSGLTKMSEASIAEEEGDEELQKLLKAGIREYGK